jgi:hypothetical protein
MKSENFEERQKLMFRFILLYAGSIALVILGFVALSSRGPVVAEKPAQGSGADKQQADRLTAELDSTRQQVWRLRREMLIKDSLIDKLAMAPVPDIADGAFEKQELVRMGRAQTVLRESLEKIRTDSAVLRRQLDDQVKSGSALKDQVFNLRSNNEALQTRLVTDDGPGGGANAKTAALQRQSAQLNDDLRFAEVDCSLSRADAKQVVYNSRQRKELLTDALTTLNELVKSPDAEVVRKARERLITLRSIASTVHD